MRAGQPVIAASQELEFVNGIAERFPKVTDVWLMGSRANDTAREDSDWDFMIFTDAATVIALQNESIPENIDLLCVYDGNRFTNPQCTKRGSLRKWKWKSVDKTIAEYEGNERRDGECIGVHGIKCKAVKIWPAQC